MSQKIRWLWGIYSIIVFLFVLRKAYNCFYPDAPAHLYFSILLAFDPCFIFSYYLNVMQIILGFIHCIPLILYIFRISWLRATIWKYLLILRLIFDICGHPLETNILVSLYYADPKICLLVFIQSIAIYIPSYIACYRYAFKTSGVRPQV